jgi:acyl carrier protein
MAIGSAAAIRRTARARASVTESVTDGMTQNPTTGVAASDVRTLIADHLGVDIARVTDEAHLADDLGADWLDRLELMIVIEDRFGDVEISDDDVDRIDVVGDLIRHVESASRERRQRGGLMRQ